MSFQGAVSVGENTKQINKYPDRWDQYANIEKGLTANSSFLILFIDYKWWCFGYMIVALSILSFIVGMFQQFSRNYLYLVNGAIIYAFAEFWRLFWFGSGIMIVLVVIPILTVLFVILLKSIPIWKKQTLE